MSRARLVLCVLVPFAAGYYLSYLFRSINALIAGDLQAELDLSAADLGALTSTYFLVFAAVLLPCGVLLDRYGPRLIDSALLLLAAVGSLVFALADGVWTLMLGRALIGLGVAVGLMAGLKAIVLWFPPQRIALANGWYIMLGALGALSATGPAEVLVHSVGWRGLFAILAAASAGVAFLILLVVPDKKQAQAAGSTPTISFLAIFRDPRFWRMAPLSATGVGVSWSLQGLWAAPWLTDVTGLDRSAVVEHLTLMAAVLSASALLLGALAERLRRAGDLDRAVPCRYTRPVDGGPARLASRFPRILLPAVRDHRHRRRHDRAQLRNPRAVLSKRGRGPCQCGPRRPQHGHGVRSAVSLRAHHRAVARGRRALSCPSA